MRLLLIFLSLFFFNNSYCQNTVGLIESSPDNVSDGYTLFSPMGQLKTFLINNDGQIVNSWQSEFVTGFTVYLDEEGNLFRGGQYGPEGAINGPGGGGVIEKFDWDNNLLWQYFYSDSEKRHHHDFEVLPNGNIIIIGWELKSETESVENGRLPGTLDEGELFACHLVEVKPSGATGGDIVWEWYVWDHLIQDNDPSKRNYGSVSEHPELIDINYFTSVRKSWNHINYVDYNAEQDLIMLSAHAYSEVWIIDHSTSSEEAASHSGGFYGRGGDLLYRWGNPQAYKKGDDQDRKLFSQHFTHWIPEGLPNAGEIMLFNNGEFRESNYSSIDIFDPGTFTYNNTGLFEPLAFTSSYTSNPQEDFFSLRFSSAQQLPNGNILICEGAKGNLFEVNSSGERVWLYVNPVNPEQVYKQGDIAVGNTVFMAHKYSIEFNGFNGKDLSPKGFIELYDQVTSNDLNKDINTTTLEIYPNPASRQLVIKGSIGNIITIKNVAGQELMSIELTQKSQVINIEQLPDGLYHIHSPNGRVVRLIIN
ncbi:aryl-sulfate sulfotransferase [Fulvivirga lutea]|uniref:Aryl-sulfate sulfotransferase n=1 Tax=Fulvivirga lutea TaxID=2810512 RepID=A0A975A194_9BACT|nr:aryl-sulfate sulfotransferase [Fulvivirga lutea]QSE97287.1 aryl-sulfate sulfotransferase [Fulvivirga lutea]